MIELQRLSSFSANCFSFRCFSFSRFLGNFSLHNFSFRGLPNNFSFCFSSNRLFANYFSLNRFLANYFFCFSFRRFANSFFSFDWHIVFCFLIKVCNNFRPQIILFAKLFYLPLIIGQIKNKNKLFKTKKGITFLKNFLRLQKIFNLKQKQPREKFSDLFLKKYLFEFAFFVCNL